MDERGTRHPDRIAAPRALGNQDLGHEHVVDGFFARDLTAHELEIAPSFAFAEERRGMDEHSFGAVLRRTGGDELPFLDATPFTHPELALVVEHEPAVHARFVRHAPLPFDFHIRGQVRGRKEVVREHAIRRRGHEARVGRRCELGGVEVGGRDDHGLNMTPFSVSVVGYRRSHIRPVSIPCA